MIVLGRFYTRTLVTVSNQELVNRGAYRLVRHPGYRGSLLTWTGASLALAPQNWLQFCPLTLRSSANRSNHAIDADHYSCGTVIPRSTLDPKNPRRPSSVMRPGPTPLKWGMAAKLRSTGVR
jgi:hypothetical protein